MTAKLYQHQDSWEFLLDPLFSRRHCDRWSFPRLEVEYGPLSKDRWCVMQAPQGMSFFLTVLQGPGLLQENLELLSTRDFANHLRRCTSPSQDFCGHWSCGVKVEELFNSGP